MIGAAGQGRLVNEDGHESQAGQAEPHPYGPVLESSACFFLLMGLFAVLQDWPQPVQLLLKPLRLGLHRLFFHTPLCTTDRPEDKGRGLRTSPPHRWRYTGAREKAGQVRAAATVLRGCGMSRPPRGGKTIAAAVWRRSPSPLCGGGPAGIAESRDRSSPARRPGWDRERPVPAPPNSCSSISANAARGTTSAYETF